jgi:polyisoprenoid-binding protein YceI
LSYNYRSPTFSSAVVVNSIRTVPFPHRIAIAAALCLSPFALALTRPAEPPTPVAITLDPVHSVALFRIQHLEAGLFWGRFNALEGTVRWDLQPNSAPVFEVSARIANADTGSEKLDQNLQGPNFFNAKEFPVMTFKSTSAANQGERRWKVKGNLTLRGVTREVEAVCVATGIGNGPAGTKVGFECTLEIRRSDFGMKWGIEKPAKALGDDVRLVIALEGDVQAKE